VSPQEIQRAAHTVECFLNALRLEDGPDRTRVEESLVKWLTSDQASKPHAIYTRSNIHCYDGDQLARSFSLPAVSEPLTIWCDRKKLSVIDNRAYVSSGKVVMLGTAGLMLALPGSPEEEDPNRPGEAKQSNNNNNNNNNNNG